MRKYLSHMLAVVMFCSLALAMSACNTMEGAGKDVEKGGEKLQDAAD